MAIGGRGLIVLIPLTTVVFANFYDCEINKIKLLNTSISNKHYQILPLTSNNTHCIYAKDFYINNAFQVV